MKILCQQGLQKRSLNLLQRYEPIPVASHELLKYLSKYLWVQIFLVFKLSKSLLTYVLFKLQEPRY